MSKICKCGHERKSHGKFIKICNECPCSNYLRHTRPNKFDLIMFGFIIFAIAILISIPVILYILISELPDEVRDQTFMKAYNPDEEDVGIGTVGEMYEMLLLLMFVIVVVFSAWYSEFIFDYYRMKKRKNWNEQNNKS